MGLMIAAAATAVARRYEVQVMPGYRESGNIWIAVALMSGNRKSFVQRAICAPLVEWERDAGAASTAVISRATSAAKTLLARAAAARADAARARDPIEISVASAEAEDLEAEVAARPIPVAPQLWVSNVTPEKLGMLLADQGEHLAWLSSEAGLFDMLAGRYSKGGVADLDIFLKGWSGDPDSSARVGRLAVYLSRPLLTIGLSPQPEVLSGLAAHPEFSARGLVARFIYLLPPSPIGYRNLDSARAGSCIGAEVAAAYHAGLRAMLDWPADTDSAGKPAHYTCYLSPDAYQVWLAYARAVEARMRPDGDLAHSTATGSKMQGQAARFALIMHCLRHAHGCPQAEPIDAETMRAAVEVAEAVLEHSLAVFHLMGADTTVAAAETVWEWIERGRRENAKVRDAHIALRSRFPRAAMLAEALEALEERGYVRVQALPAGPRGGRPSERIVVRPDIAQRWT